MEKVFRDPIHGYIYIQDQIILDLINTKEFQRLRRIKQLGTTSFTFHGAEHSRFGHCLGVYEITRQICDQFQRNYPKEIYGKDGWNDSERLVTLCAALLHDIGHGAYSHTFEHLFDTNHEQIGIEIILSPTTEIHQVLTQVSPDFPEKVAAVIAKKYPNPQVVQMISSQADADRMDYLRRDAYYTGVEYGNYDLTRMLRVMRPYAKGICFKEEGMHAIEDYIVSRYQMFMQVYFHPVSRGMEVILQRLLERARDLYDQDSHYFKQHCELLVPFFSQRYTLEDYLALTDDVLLTYFQLWTKAKDPILSDLACRFINRKPFKSIPIPSQLDQRKLRGAKVILQKIGYNPTYYSGLNDASDLPYDIYRSRIHHPRTQIELMRHDGSFFELSTKSEIVKALSGETIIDRRFYFPREMVKPTQTLEQNSEILRFQQWIQQTLDRNVTKL